MSGLVLACGDAAELVASTDSRALDGVPVEPVPARPGRREVDPLLGPSVVVAGTDADLAAVLLRLLRKDRLATTTVGYVPSDRDSAVARLWALPTDPAEALDLALTGEARPVALVRDDAGGVLAGSGLLAPVRGIGYCDDTVALRGDASSIEVHAGVAGLVVTVTRGRWRRRRTIHEGRAFQLGCEPTTPVLDGVAYPRSMQRWTWYRHTEDLRLIRPV
ncbi:hypothetical protein B1813_13450 [Saccharomonospora piscinae]|uniref:DAGKc domain-containing protein n=1 Tax=Saccharomonospora piscinae TaxID=687388 RepID=A0A1V9A0H0_SACPI|nr:hypothetical protein [Saccharomonospora piscinae]OQO90560.1 hypothetical protein B1813_13450 [Saccharomonospora piscinae]TLW93231.1 hypothetical protein FFT09_07380 [Saccharomonospora piscinae]